MINISLKSNWLYEQSKNAKDVFAIISDNIKLTYGQLNSLVSIFSRNLKSNLNKNDFVLVQLNNSVEFVCTIFSLWNIGCVPVVIDPNLTKNEFEKINKEAGIKIRLMDNKLFSLALSDFNLSVNKYQDNDLITYPNKSAVVLFTSGTVGTPKAVLLSFENLYHSANATDSITNAKLNDKWLATLPFYHIGGFSIITRSLLSGTTLCIPKSLKTEDIISAIRFFDPSFISLVPTQVNRILDNKIYFNPNLKRIFIGGSKINNDIAKKLVELKLPITIVYGSTETCSMISAISDKEILSQPNSVGKPLCETKIKIIDANGNELEANKEGLILIDGLTVAEGYLKNKLQKFNGKFLTKDFGYLDKEGNLFVCSRSDGIIISGEKKIDPDEIEEILLGNSKIQDCAVIGVEDNEWGQKVVAIIVKQDNLNISNSEIFDYLKDKIVNYKIPKQIIFVEEIPKNLLGKKDTKKILSLIVEHARA